LKIPADPVSLDEKEVEVEVEEEEDLVEGVTDRPISDLELLHRLDSEPSLSSDIETDV